VGGRYFYFRFSGQRHQQLGPRRRHAGRDRTRNPAGIPRKKGGIIPAPDAGDRLRGGNGSDLDMGCFFSRLLPTGGISAVRIDLRVNPCIPIKKFCSHKGHRGSEGFFPILCPRLNRLYEHVINDLPIVKFNGARKEGSQKGLRPIGEKIVKVDSCR